MHAPGPRGRLISGSLREFDRDKLEFFSELTREYGDLSSFRLGPVRLYLASHPDMVREILIDNARSYQKAERHIALFRRFLGDSMLTLEGAAQRQHRKLSLPAFNHANLATYGETMVDCTLRRISSWREGVE